MFKSILAGIWKRLGGQKMPAGTRLGTADLNSRFRLYDRMGNSSVVSGWLIYLPIQLINDISLCHVIYYNALLYFWPMSKLLRNQTKKSDFTLIFGD
jgi:hypothetical protein